MRRQSIINMTVGLILCLGLGACEVGQEADPAAYESYDIVSAGTRQFEWDTDTGPGIIKVLIEENNLGSQGAEIAEIWFPPGFEASRIRTNSKSSMSLKASLIISLTVNHTS